jgi:hypothetical protein
MSKVILLNLFILFIILPSLFLELKSTKQKLVPIKEDFIVINNEELNLKKSQEDWSFSVVIDEIRFDAKITSCGSEGSNRISYCWVEINNSSDSNFIFNIIEFIEVFESIYPGKSISAIVLDDVNNFIIQNFLLVEPIQLWIQNSQQIAILNSSFRTLRLVNSQNIMVSDVNITYSFSGESISNVSLLSSNFKTPRYNYESILSIIDANNIVIGDNSIRGIINLEQINRLIFENNSIDSRGISLQGINIGEISNNIVHNCQLCFNIKGDDIRIINNTLAHYTDSFSLSDCSPYVQICFLQKTIYVVKIINSKNITIINNQIYNFTLSTTKTDAVLKIYIFYLENSENINFKDNIIQNNTITGGKGGVYKVYCEENCDYSINDSNANSIDFILVINALFIALIMFKKKKKRDY